MTPRGPELGAGAEFDLVRALVARWGDLARGIGDDAALVAPPRGETMVASTDVAVEGVHFRLDWMSPADAGYRAVMAALSDIAAMAAAPRGMLLSFVAPPDRRQLLLDLADGIGQAARDAGCPIVGGNVARGSELSLTTTVLGSAFAPLARAGAAPGQHVYVTGTLGGPAAAIRALNDGRTPVALHLDRLTRPRARIREARWLAARGATACIDISDGLVGDAGHLAAANALGVEIVADDIPALDGASLDDALAGGEEYELLVTARAPMDEAAFRDAFGIPLTCVGRMSGIAGAGVVVTQGGRRIEAPRGYDHFSA
jgi:thiamine-monophosphate kinase